MKALRHHRRSAVGALFALGMLGTLVTFVVLPALATPANQPIPPRSAQQSIMPYDIPTGGQSNDCDVFYPNGGKPSYSYRIANPKSQTYNTKVGPNNTPVSFTLQMNPPSSLATPAYAGDKYVSVTQSTGAAIVDIGIKGGTDTARYNYSGVFSGNTNYGFVTADTYLHGPAQSALSDGTPTSLYSVSNLTFCFNLGSSVSGTVFNDKDNSGSNTPGDVPQQGWTVNLYNGSTFAASTQSVATTGAYSFSNLAIGGTYSVCIVGQTGWRQTLPTSSTSGSTACPGTHPPTNPPESARGYMFTLDSAKTGLDFGNVQLQSISGLAFSDANGDGNSTGDTGQSGLTVTLYHGSDPPLTATTKTAAQGVLGTYQFDNLVVGATYKVCISTPTPGSWIETKPSSSPSCSAVGQSPWGYSITLTAAGTTNADFGHQPLGSVSGTVYQDVNQDGTKNGTDTALSGWTVNLYHGGSSPIATTTSGADGLYRFDLTFVPDSTYKICEAPPSGIWAQSQPFPNTPNICSAGGELIKGYQFTPLTSTDTVTAKDLGNVPAVYQPCDPPVPFGPATSGDVSYLIQLAACKPGQTFVFSLTPAVVDGNGSNTPPTVSVWVGDETQIPKVPLVEKIVFPFTIQPGASEPLLILHYDDVFPLSVVDAPTMPFCNLDPRDPAAIPNPDFALLAAYTSHSGAGFVLPSGATSCLIVQTESSTRLGSASGPGTYTAYVYSELDGLRYGAP